MSMTCQECGATLTGQEPDGVCPRCAMSFAVEASSEWEELLFQGAFKDLEILEKLGEGGMGVVFKARQPSLDRVVALKILPERLAEDPEFVRRFDREAKALARLSHPNIVAIHDFGLHQGRYYFVMEFVDGVNLRRLMGQRKLDPERALTLVPQICEALEYAHGEGVVHRDIKPENILIDSKGRVKLADFGLAKIVHGDTALGTLTRSSVVMGTPQYMAPEQLQNPKQVDHRADLYSLGVILYEMLTGELPVGRFAPPSSKAGVDVRLDDVVHKALENDPEQRYQRASEIRDAVTHLETTRPALRRSSYPNDLLMAEILFAMACFAAVVFAMIAHSTHAHDRAVSRDEATAGLVLFAGAFLMLAVRQSRVAFHHSMTAEWSNFLRRWPLGLTFMSASYIAGVTALCFGNIEAKDAGQIPLVFPLFTWPVLLVLFWQKPKAARVVETPPIEDSTTRRRFSHLAIWSLVISGGSGLCAVMALGGGLRGDVRDVEAGLGTGVICFLLSVGLGVSALAAIKNAKGRLAGKSLAVVGILLSIAFLLLGLLGYVEADNLERRRQVWGESRPHEPPVITLESLQLSQRDLPRGLAFGNKTLGDDWDGMPKVLVGTELNKFPGLPLKNEDLYILGCRRSLISATHPSTLVIYLFECNGSEAAEKIYWCCSKVGGGRSFAYQVGIFVVLLCDLDGNAAEYAAVLATIKKRCGLVQ